MPISRRALLSCSAAAFGSRAYAQQLQQWQSRELRRFKAPEAAQAVAVDAEHFYAIGNHVIGKYDKASGKREGLWECPKGKPLLHLNSGVVHDGVLYCAHSNYPETPMVSSIEMWDAKSLKHIDTQSFGIYIGSLTWIDFIDKRRFITFGHYGRKAGEPNKDPRYTSLLEVDGQWQRLKGWVYPPEVISRLGAFTISGGTFASDGRLFCTGHDHPEIYVLKFPSGGSVLEFEAVFPAPNPGQGIAFDRSERWTMYSIDRGPREVIVTTLRSS